MLGTDISIPKNIITPFQDVITLSIIEDTLLYFGRTGCPSLQDRRLSKIGTKVILMLGRGARTGTEGRLTGDSGTEK
jgi:hypothetical protein